jgi:methionine aminopeptidase
MLLVAHFSTTRELQRTHTHTYIHTYTCASCLHCCGFLVVIDVDDSDLAAHIDGFIGVVGHTVVCTADPATAATGRKADATIAAYYAAEAALRLLRPGNKSTQVTPVLERVAEIFHCNLVEGVVSHQIGRFVLEGEKVIPGRVNPEQRNAEITFEENEVYSIDIMMSTGDGKLRERDTRTTVFKRETTVGYNLQMKSSKAIFSQINKRFPSLPFTLRYVVASEPGLWC